MKGTAIASLLVFNIIAIASGQTNYCALCANHIACNNPGTFAPTCPADATIVPLGANEQAVVLNEHNTFRNRLAGGQISGFRSATTMRKVYWDAELAWLAELNVRQCEMRHDACRATPAFPYAGQNLYWGGTSGAFPDVSNSLREAIQLWYNEYQKASQADIDTCCGGNNFPNIGHFLQIAQDNVIRVGCAVARYTQQWRTTLIACNYSWGNILGWPVYVSGTAGSGCTNGRDSVFTNLCL